ncbi:prostate stem cell antigen-like [Morone saxatilis]|uniref:prostate stem cell antigen-like n=1 Tax=Morone saxatilis TaxID=34816 RepID=UPI0015E1F86B|nr:prostate stem cell antigen-like [Morone saxatilis]
MRSLLDQPYSGLWGGGGVFVRKCKCSTERFGRPLSITSLTCLINKLFFSLFTMKLYGALILFMTLSTACGLRCYTCTAADPKSCTDTKSCSVIFNRCFSLRVDGYSMVTKGCQTSLACVGAIKCCEGNLCNSAMPIGPSVVLLLISSAIITLLH